MPNLNLPVTEVAKAIDTRAYNAMLKVVIGSSATFDGDTLQRAQTRSLVEQIHNDQPLNSGTIADLHLDGDMMAAFIVDLVASVPPAVGSAFASGWNPATRKNGGELAARIVAAAAYLPEGPFLYILSVLCRTETWPHVPGSKTVRFESDRPSYHWAELFSGNINGLIERAPQESNTYLKIAGERLKGLALLAHSTKDGQAILEKAHNRGGSPYDTYTLGRVAEAALGGGIEFSDSNSQALTTQYCM